MSTPKKISQTNSDIVFQLAQSANALVHARLIAPAGSDLRKMLDNIGDQLDDVAHRICGYKFNDAGELVDTSPVRMV